MPQPRHGAAGVQVQRRRGMGGQWGVAGVAQRAGGKEAGETAASRRIGLQHVNRPGAQHAVEIGRVVAELARRHLDRGRNARPHRRQPREVVAGYRFLEPAYSVLDAAFGEGERLPGRERAVGVHQQAGFRPDRGARQPYPSVVVLGPGADLHLHVTQAFAGQAAELRLQLGVIVRGESAAAVNRNFVPPNAEKPGERHIQQLRFEVPKGRVHRGDRRGAQPIAAELRTARRIAVQANPTAIASIPATTGANTSAITRTAAALA